MDIKNLETFIQAAELCSFTRAAEKLGYSQSTVSFQIHQLEESLGVQLFERVNRTVALTDAGRRVLRCAHEIDRLALELNHELHPGSQVSGRVRLAMADSMTRFLLGQRFGEFHRLYPQILLTVITTSTEEMFRLLNQNEADLVCTLDSHIYDSEYIIAHEERMDVHFVAAPGYLTNTERPLTAEQLLAYPFLLTEKRMSYRRLMDEAFARLSLEAVPVLEVGGTDLICRLVAEGEGISFLPDFVTEELVREGRLVRLDVEGFELPVWSQLLHHRDKWVFPAMEAVVTYLSGRPHQDARAKTSPA